MKSFPTLATTSDPIYLKTKRCCVCGSIKAHHGFNVRARSRMRGEQGSWGDWYCNQHRPDTGVDSHPRDKRDWL